MAQFIVLHMEKRMEVSPVLERHIVRMEVRYVDGVREETVWVPDNADEERAHLNRELIARIAKDERTGKTKNLTIQQAVNRRIEEAGIGKVRNNQNTSIEIIFSGSPETMCAMSQDQVSNWANDTLAWAQDRWGYENVVSATLHCDEKTPHIHMIVVPIVQGQSRRSASQERKDEAKGISTKKYKKDTTRNRLCANEVYTKPLLYGYHTSYAESVGEKYGLSRGIRAEKGSRKIHTNSIEYNRMLAQEALEKEKLIKELTSEYTDKERILSELNSDIETRRKQQLTLKSQVKAVIDALHYKHSIEINEVAEYTQELRDCAQSLVFHFDRFKKLIPPEREELEHRDQLFKLYNEDLKKVFQEERIRLYMNDLNKHLVAMSGRMVKIYKRYCNHFKDLAKENESLRKELKSVKQELFKLQKRKKGISV